jgi:hypothetical protein
VNLTTQLFSGHPGKADEGKEDRGQRG